MIAAEPIRNGKLPASDFVAPRNKRRLRVLVVGASPAAPSVRKAVEAMGADEVMCIDGDLAVVARQRLKTTPPDVVLVVGPLWSEGAALAARETIVGLQARRYLTGGFPLRWLHRGVVVELRAMPAPGAA